MGGGLVGSLGLDKGRNPNHSDQEKDISENHYNKALMYFTPEQFKITEFEET